MEILAGIIMLVMNFPGNATMIGGTIQFKLKSDHGADAGTKGYMLKLKVVQMVQLRKNGCRW